MILFLSSKAEKATSYERIFYLVLTFIYYLVSNVKRKWEIFSNFVAL